ncbi:MAG: hypothetical protein WA618_21130 [Terriglobales bacterium]|jgi:hypothetical protein
MPNELKAYNEFGEMILHLRFPSGGNPGMLTIDATKEMQTAINGLRDRDLDVVVQKGSEQLRFSAKWGSAEFAQVLAGYLVNNFGWTTKVLETHIPSLTNAVSASGTSITFSGSFGNAFPPATFSNVSSPGLTSIAFANLVVDDPTRRPSLSLVLQNTATSLITDRK